MTHQLNNCDDNTCDVNTCEGTNPIQQNILEWNLNNEREYSIDSCSSSEEYLNDIEDPLPKWNIPNWKGNAKEEDIMICCNCIKRVMSDGDKRGCEKCDEFWDMPDLIEMDNDLIEMDNDENENEDENANNVYYNDDDNYDQPDEMYLAERMYMQSEEGQKEERELDLLRRKNKNLSYCEGCELLAAGLGGENQLCHTCLVY